MTRVEVIAGAVHVMTAAGHALKHAGRGKPRQVICLRCERRLFIGATLTVEEAGAELARLVEEHGQIGGCP